MQQLSPKLWRIRTALVHWCPGCRNFHIIDVDAPNPRNGARWTWDGNAEAPTLSPSVNVGPGYCHSFLRAGRIEFLGDCKHALVGQTVDLPDMPAEEIEWLEGLAAEK